MIDIAFPEIGFMINNTVAAKLCLVCRYLAVGVDELMSDNFICRLMLITLV
jgi:hypothetical protein